METLVQPRKVTREDILMMQEYISQAEGAVFGNNDLCPLKHTFADGMYVREIFIPADMYVVGRIHKHSHPNFLLSGTVVIATEFGSETLVGPIALISEAGTKRALYTVTDVVWCTVHANPDNLREVEELEDLILAASYEEYEQFKLQQSTEKISWVRYG